jgi:hypothetical protein
LTTDAQKGGAIASIFVPVGGVVKAAGGAAKAAKGGKAADALGDATNAARGADAAKADAGMDTAKATEGAAAREGMVVKPKALPPISRKISVQKQNRHIKGKKEHDEVKGYLNNVEEAQKVLDAYHSGEATVLGTAKNGHLVIRYDGVTGINVNTKSGYPMQPTNVFLIKGTAHPSIVPTNPNWRP